MSGKEIVVQISKTLRLNRPLDVRLSELMSLQPKQRRSKKLQDVQWQTVLQRCADFLEGAVLADFSEALLGTGRLSLVAELRRAGLSALASYMGINRSITEIDLSRAELDIHGIQALGTALQKNTYLKTVCVYHYKLPVQDVKTNVELDFADRKLCQYDACLICQLSVSNLRLESMDLPNNKVGATGKKICLNSTSQCTVIIEYLRFSQALSTFPKCYTVTRL